MDDYTDVGGRAKQEARADASERDKMNRLYKVYITVGYSLMRAVNYGIQDNIF
jgi:hypothetical protein